VLRNETKEHISGIAEGAFIVLSEPAKGCGALAFAQFAPRPLSKAVRNSTTRRPTKFTDLSCAVCHLRHALRRRARTLSQARHAQAQWGIGNALGVARVLLMYLCSLSARNGSGCRAKARTRRWLDYHILMVVGPVLITFHSSFKTAGRSRIYVLEHDRVVVSGGRYALARPGTVHAARETTDGNRLPRRAAPVDPMAAARESQQADYGPCGGQPGVSDHPEAGRLLRAPSPVALLAGAAVVRKATNLCWPLKPNPSTQLPKSGIEPRAFVLHLIQLVKRC
jgi:hypothetical protein